METRIDEVADGIFRLSTWTDKIPPDGFTFNQFLIRAEQPMLFHCGHRAMFGQIREAVARLIRSNACAGSAFPISRPTRAAP